MVLVCGEEGHLAGATLKEQLLCDLKAGVNETFASGLKAKVSECIVPLDPGTHLGAFVISLGVKGRVAYALELVWDQVHSKRATGNHLEFIRLKEELSSHRGELVSSGVGASLCLVQHSHSHIGVLCELDCTLLEDGLGDVSLASLCSESHRGVDLHFELLEGRVDLSSRLGVETDDLVSVVVERGSVGCERFHL